MRALELAKVAAAAEALRLRRFARRQGLRVAFAIGGATFGVAVFVLLHVVIYDLLLMLVKQPWLAALILLVIDMVVAGVLGAMAINSKPDRIEQEALAVRRQSLGEARRAVTVMAVAGELTSVALRRRSRRDTATRAGSLWAVADLAARFLRRR